MRAASQLLLTGAVTAVGVLHTMVPDHWLPIVLLAKQRGWSQRETATAALQAGTGHVLSTLAIGLLVWGAGVTAARRFGSAIETLSSLALIGFGLWIALSSWREQHHQHSHAHAHDPNVHKKGPKSRTTLLLILGSSPMVEAIPAFFAATKWGLAQIAGMSAVFAASTILTYVALCVSSLAGLGRLRLAALERYGEVFSGAAIAIIGVTFWMWPAL